MARGILVLTFVFAFSSLALFGAVSFPLIAASESGTQRAPELHDARHDAPLQPLPADSEGKQRLLQALSRQLGHAESQQGQGDVYLEVKTKRNPLLVGSATSAAEYASPREGRIAKAPAKALVPQVEAFRLRWAYDGPKVRCERKLVRAPGETASSDDHFETSYDGRCTAVYYPAQESGAVATGLAGPASKPEGPRLTMSTVGRKPISELLSVPGAVYEGSQVLDGVECRKISLPYESGKLEIWLSPSHGLRAKRVSYTGPQIGDVSLSEVTEAEGFADYGGTWFPTKGTYTRYRSDRNGVKEWAESTEWRVISYKPSTPDALFTIHFPIGTKVHDASGEKPRDYTVGEDEKATTVTTSSKGVK